MIENYSNCVVFVIDTDQYAGNFEREMCAHVTGRIGECEVGEEYVDDEIRDLFDNVIDMPDDSDCYRPTTCFLSKDGKSNNSVAIFFDKNEPPTDEQIEIMKERSLTFLHAYRTVGDMAEFNKNKTINIFGYRLIKYLTEITEMEV